MPGASFWSARSCSKRCAWASSRAWALRQARTSCSSICRRTDAVSGVASSSCCRIVNAPAMSCFAPVSASAKGAAASSPNCACAKPSSCSESWTESSVWTRRLFASASRSLPDIRARSSRPPRPRSPGAVPGALPVASRCVASHQTMSTAPRITSRIAISVARVPSPPPWPDAVPGFAAADVGTVAGVATGIGARVGEGVERAARSAPAKSVAALAGSLARRFVGSVRARSSVRSASATRTASPFQ